MRYLTWFILPLLAGAVRRGTKIVLTNDDGWAVAQIRAQNDALKAAGYDVILSSPAENESGTASKEATPTVLNITCEFDTCPVGSPPEGSDQFDPRINYVNSFPVNAVRFGIQDLAPKFFHSRPEFVISGPNVGTNLGSGINGSGTVGAACEAAKEGLASTAFSGKSTTQEAFTNLAQTPNSSTILAARTYAELTTFFTTELLASPARPIIPPNITLNVNLAPTTDCPTASDFSFVLTRLLPDASATDVEICGTDHLPDETTVINSGCFVTISVMNAIAKTDVDAKTQAAILKRIAHILTCVS